MTSRLRTLLGVLSVTAALDFPPFGGIDTDFEIPGKTHTESWKGQMGFCDPDFFPTIGMRLLRGHLFTVADVASKRKVAVINQQLAKKFLAGEDPVGCRRPHALGDFSRFAGKMAARDLKLFSNRGEHSQRGTPTRTHQYYLTALRSATIVRSPPRNIRGSPGGGNGGKSQLSMES